MNESKYNSRINSSLLAFLVIVNLVLVIFLFNSSRSDNNVSFSELNSLDANMGFDELTAYFKKLAEEKGGRYAFQVLKVAELGENIDLHLLGHEVGNVLYKQEGISAITACDNDFRNACSHSVVIGIFEDNGETALKDIAEACKKAPGGIGAYTMCFHGLGHGILSYEGYDMEKASKICQKTGTAEYGYNESAQCISGTVMEIIGGGFHDRDIWTDQRIKYLDKNKPLSLCQKDFIPENAKSFCYDYLTPFLFEAVGANIGSPTDEDFKKAFKICDSIPLNQAGYRDACFGGFGKEFNGLVQGRDIRMDSVNSISKEKLGKIHDWCMLTDKVDDQKSCIIHAMNSLYWGGENDKMVPINFCTVSRTEELRGLCFSNLNGSVSYYIKDRNYRVDYCSKIPENYKEECQKALLN
ncbi:MAG: hypothetical protein WAX44_00040 [Minisyncoccia bacterium]